MITCTPGCQAIPLLAVQRSIARDVTSRARRLRSQSLVGGRLQLMCCMASLRAGMRLQVSSQVTFLAALLRTLSRNPVPILGTRIRTQNGDVIFKFISHVPVLGTRSGTQNRNMNLTIYVQTAISFCDRLGPKSKPGGANANRMLTFALEG